jgi:hypothetical protein
MSLSLPSVAVLAIAASAASPASSQAILGIDGLLGDLYSIDTMTGQASYRGSTGLNQWIWTSIAQDSQGRIVAGYVDYITLSRADLYEIDPLTSQVSFIVSTSLIGLAGLAFGPADVLYAVNDRFPGVAYSPDDLYSVDCNTGAASLVGGIGTTVLTNLAFGQGWLWGYDAVMGLVQIDPMTGIGADVNPSFRGHVDLAESICFGPGEVLFLIDYGYWIMDPNSGVPVLAGFTNYPGYFSGVEFLPGSIPPFTLGTLGQTGGPMGLEVWGATPNSTIAFLRALGGGGPTPVASGYPCAGTLLDLNAGLRLAAVAAADAQGHALLGPITVPASAAGTLRLQALDLATCRTSNLARLIY